MKGIEDLLPASPFLRVHRSSIVSMADIEKIHKQYIVVNQVILPIGELYRDNFLKKVLN